MGRRCIGLDAHRDFAQVAVWEDGKVRQAGQIAMTAEALRIFADSLCPEDEVAIEATCNTHAIVLAPSTPQEMLDLTRLAFELSFRYRNPVVVVADGYLGQMTGKVVLPATAIQPGLPDWAVFGDGAHRGNLISSIYLDERDLEKHNERLNEKYRRMEAEERSDAFSCSDATTLVVAFGTPARMAKGAVEALRREGVNAGLFRPLTLWPFPIAALKAFLPHVKRILVVEASNGQLEDELRLALSKAGLTQPPIENVRHAGGILPQAAEIAAAVRASEEVLA